MERRRTATATGLYESFCHIFFFFLHSFSLHLFVPQEILNDEERPNEEATASSCLNVATDLVCTACSGRGLATRRPRVEPYLLTYLLTYFLTTGKARSPRVVRLVEGTTSMAELQNADGGECRRQMSGESSVVEVRGECGGFSLPCSHLSPPPAIV